MGMRMNKRDRKSLRADKYWQSVWHRQMLIESTPLTSVSNGGRTIETQKENTKCQIPTLSTSLDHQSITK